MASDTTPAAASRRLTVLRGMDGAERLARALELSEVVRQLAKQGEKDRSEAA